MTKTPARMAPNILEESEVEGEKVQSMHIIKNRSRHTKYTTVLQRQQSHFINKKKSSQEHFMSLHCALISPFVHLLE